MTTKKIHRYPGVKPFETSEKDLFFGRGRDIQDLYDLISLEKLVVLFGKSGYGKSSILNAGIVPKLVADHEADEDAYEIIKIRLGAFSEEKKDEKGKVIQSRKLSPIDFVRHELNKKTQIQIDAAFLDSLSPEKMLWYDFKSRQSADKSLRFVLLFDQFEEFFSYPIAEQNAFKQEISTLLYENIPQDVRDAANNLDRKDRVWLARNMDIKIVFAIRADKMNFLHSLADALPAILHKRYELKALTSEQAKEAIVQPASIKGDTFISPAFEYTPAALDKIIAALTEANSDTKAQGIEAFQLQLLCEYLENKVINGEVSDIDGNGLPDITPDTLPVMERLYEEYYHRKLNDLPQESRLAAQLVLEDGLFAEDSATGEGLRMSVDSHALLAQFCSKGLNESVLQLLANTFLIRPETNTVGGISYEISHDTLLAPIQKAKAERKAKEEKEALAAKAASEKAEKEKAQRQLRTVQMLLALAVVALLVAVGTIFYAFKQKEKADAATIEADRKTRAALHADSLAQIEKTNALEKTKAAKRSDSLAQIEKKNADAKTIAAKRSDSLAQIEKKNAEEKTKEAIKEKQNADKSLQERIAAEEAKNIAELKPLIDGIKAAIEAEEMKSAKEKYKAALEKHGDSKELRELGQKDKLE